MTCEGPARLGEPSGPISVTGTKPPGLSPRHDPPWSGSHSTRSAVGGPSSPGNEPGHLLRGHGRTWNIPVGVPGRAPSLKGTWWPPPRLPTAEAHPPPDLAPHVKQTQDLQSHPLSQALGRCKVAWPFLLAPAVTLPPHPRPAPPRGTWLPGTGTSPTAFSPPAARPNGRKQPGWRLAPPRVVLRPPPGSVPPRRPGPSSGAAAGSVTPALHPPPPQSRWLLDLKRVK